MLHDTRGPFRTMVDPAAGTVDRAIFADDDIYQLELERIFARAWNFMCHESQIPKPGDFFLSFIGEESVIATRDKKGELQVLLNSCRHRGNAVCRAESGNARSFLCTYHGWTYGLDGSLIGVPGYKDFYHEQLDRSSWGLVKAGKVASYKGFVFATMDPEAPDLEDYLGPVGRMGMDLIAARGEGVIVEGVQKNQITCNWKLAVDNLFDWYHPQISHASAGMSGLLSAPPKPGEAPEPVSLVGDPKDHRVLLGAFGHAISGPRLPPEMLEKLMEADDLPLNLDERWRDRPASRQALGEAGMQTQGHPNIFPNLWVATGGTQLSLRLPKGPGVTEIWWFTILDKTLSPEVWDERRLLIEHVFGPAGLLEQDDGENWDQSTRAMRGPIAQRYPLNFAMGVGLGRNAAPSDGGPTYINTSINEHAQLWTYRAWAEWMDADSWTSLKHNHSPAPTAGALV